MWSFVLRLSMISFLSLLLPVLSAFAGEASSTTPEVLSKDAVIFGDWHLDKPGLRHRITPNDMPEPYQTRSAGNPPRLIKRPNEVKPIAPIGFQVNLFADNLTEPRIIRTAPNGDIFVSETEAGRVRVLHPNADGSTAVQNTVYASGLDGPFGIAFYRKGEKQWVYIAENNRIIRFHYSDGDMKATGEPEVIVSPLTATRAGHTTRDIVFSQDGMSMFISVGSGSNVAQGLPAKTLDDIRQWEQIKAVGAAWGSEEDRANVLVFTPEGQNKKTFATGIRNCVGLAIHPASGDLYCSTNERDGLGDDLVPDYVTHVEQGRFYGWPWWYIGAHQDPRWKNARPDLADKVITPDVLLQPHSASLGMAFYTGATFPEGYRDSAFAALHGSWNRSKRTGYKVVRILMHHGKPSGEYEDFLTGFVADNDRVWGRPVGLAVTKDGSLLVSEDANGTIWRVSACK